MTINWTYSGGNQNSDAQIVYKRVKQQIPNTWDSTGFTPSNNLLPNVDSAFTTILTNRVYQFKVDNLCTNQNIISSNVFEGIDFECITLTIGDDVSFTTDSITVTISGLHETISSASFKLKNNAETIDVDTKLNVSAVSGDVTATFTGLSQNTTYKLFYELNTVINGVLMSSSNAQYIGSWCGPLAVTTDFLPNCPASENLLVTLN